MKRILILFFVLMMIVPVAYSEVIKVDLETASIEELEYARTEIDERIKQIHDSHIQEVNERIIFHGSGTKILDGVDLMVTPYRFIARSNKEIKVTLCTEERSRTYDGSNSSSYQFAYLIDKPMTVSSIMVETQGDWEIEFSPIGVMNQINASESGSYVTDRFYASEPTIVNISFNNGKYGGYTYIDLYKIMNDSKVLSEKWMWQDIVSDESFDYIIKPEDGVESYFIMISCPHDTKWVISENK